jgi:hypothetical protein
MLSDVDAVVRQALAASDIETDAYSANAVVRQIALAREALT